MHSSEINIIKYILINNNHALSLAIISFDKYRQIESYKDIKLIIRTRELAI